MTILPPRQIPRDLEPQYTMNGAIPAVYCYENDSFPPPRVYDTPMIEDFKKRIAQKETFYYKKTDQWLYDAIEKYPIKGCQVAIMGSGLPLYESICLHYGAIPITVEYNHIEARDSRIQVMHVNEYLKQQNRFECAFSISSFEHDGLGRYGDPLNPKGDLEAMAQMRKALLPNGILFLAIPTGKDQLVWNQHRIYGPTRLPLLLEGWEVLDIFGKGECRFNRMWNSHSQPVFVLRNSENPGLGDWLTDQIVHPRGRWF